MKKILSSLLLLAGFAAANTCTEAWFTMNASPFQTNGSSTYLDSIYNDDNGEFIWTSKYIYENNFPTRIVMEYKNDARTVIIPFYNTTNENVLTGNGSEVLFSASTVDDTIIYTQKSYSNGNLNEDLIHKATKHYASEIAQSKYEYVFAEFRFINDTLVNSTTYNYNTDSAETYVIYIIGNPNDDNECFAYMADTLKSTITYTANDHGFSLRKKEGLSIREYFITQVEGTTAIRKQRPAVKISPKARYFDLLGRYKFSK